MIAIAFAPFREGARCGAARGDVENQGAFGFAHQASLSAYRPRNQRSQAGSAIIIALIARALPSPKSASANTALGRAAAVPDGPAPAPPLGSGDTRARIPSSLRRTDLSFRAADRRIDLRKHGSADKTCVVENLKHARASCGSAFIKHPSVAGRKVKVGPILPEDCA